MIIGAHTIVFSNDPEADRLFFREALGLPHVDVGGGWLIFGLPPSEVAMHDAEGNAGKHELYLMCANIEGFVQDMQQRNIPCSEVQDQGWGLVMQITLPGGSPMNVYEPRHARPETREISAAKKPARRKSAAKRAAKPAKKAAKKPAKKAAKPAKKAAKKKR